MPERPTAPGASHYRALQGATESSTAPKPVTVEAIRERRRAIREGRLVVTDAQDPQTTGSVVCAGCAIGEVTYYPSPGGGALMPMEDGTPGLYVSPFTQLLGTNQLDYLVRIECVRMEVFTSAGSCKRDGSNCVEATQCATSVWFYFIISVLNDSGDGVQPTLPNVLWTDPVAAAPGIPRVITNVIQTGTETTGEFSLTYGGATQCGATAVIPTDLASLALNPSVGTWSLLLNSDNVSSLHVECTACSKGGSFPE